MVSIPTRMVTDYRDALNESVGIFLHCDGKRAVRQVEVTTMALRQPELKAHRHQ